MRGKVDRLTLTALRAPVLLEVTREWRLNEKWTESFLSEGIHMSYKYVHMW